MNIDLSVVIPNRNGSSTIGLCLESVFRQSFPGYEVIVVDDASDDGSAEVIEGFPCTLIRLEKHSGASRARNRGAGAARGPLIFFTDADCLLEPDTLTRVYNALKERGAGFVIGGTYTELSPDRGFFSDFQSAFINYSETRHPQTPDYIPTHAMALHKETFSLIGGFREDFLPILEDVEFSHRARTKGCSLIMQPDTKVRHIFDYNLVSSFRNALKKSFYWSIYSLKRRDFLRDSGTASHELKSNVLFFVLSIMVLIAGIVLGTSMLFVLVPVFFAVNCFLSRDLVRAFYQAGGIFFALKSVLYYTLLYPVPVAVGSMGGIIFYPFLRKRL